MRILKSKGLAPDLPEDLYHLIKKAAAVRKHLERKRKDKDAKFHLTLIESHIHTIIPKESSPLIGNMSHAQPLLWLHKSVYCTQAIKPLFNRKKQKQRTLKTQP